MGLKKHKAVRPPSPIHGYDYTAADHDSKYGPVSPRYPNSLTVANNSPRWQASFYGTGPGGGAGALQDWAPFDRPATGYESARNVFIVTRRSQRAASRLESPKYGAGRPVTQGAGTGRPMTQGSVPSTSQMRPSTRQRIMSAQRGVSTSLAGKSGGNMELWTAHSMLEPIFLPQSASQRLAAAQAPPLQSMSQRIEATGNRRRWEDGPGKKFWKIQEKNLRGAILRTEGNKLRAATVQGSKWQQQHDVMVEQVSFFPLFFSVSPFYTIVEAKDTYSTEKRPTQRKRDLFTLM